MHDGCVPQCADWPTQHAQHVKVQTHVKHHDEGYCILGAALFSFLFFARFAVGLGSGRRGRGRGPGAHHTLVKTRHRGADRDAHIPEFHLQWRCRLVAQEYLFLRFAVGKRIDHFTYFPIECVL